MKKEFLGKIIDWIIEVVTKIKYKSLLFLFYIFISMVGCGGGEGSYNNTDIPNLLIVGDSITSGISFDSESIPYPMTDFNEGTHPFSVLGDHPDFAVRRGFT